MGLNTPSGVTPSLSTEPMAPMSFSSVTAFAATS
jgi:hypothetical protein